MSLIAENSDLVIRSTKSVCPVCLRDVPAQIVRRQDKVMLCKLCEEHGASEIVLSRSPEFYKDLDDMYFKVMDEEKPICEHELWLTLQCDTECTICHLGTAKTDMKALNPTVQQIEAFITKNHSSSYVLSGGEPTCRDDIFEIIHLFKKHHKTVTMHTNGLKLVNKDYVRRLKESGLDRVNLQFDGLCAESYKTFRGTNLLDTKLKQLENLKLFDVPADLNMTVARDVNDFDVSNVIDYAARNSFIKGVNFFTICLLGGVRHWGLERYIMPDEVADCLEERTDHKITKRNIFWFQKLHLALKSWQGQRFCLYSQIYVLVRKGDSYEPIDKFLNLKRVQPWLDRYQFMYPRNKFLAKAMLALTVPPALLRWSSLDLIKEMVLVGFSYFFHTTYYLKSNKFLFVSFSTACDPYKIDYGLIKNCQDEIVHVDPVSGKLEYQGCDGLHCIKMEKKYRWSCPDETKGCG